MYADETDPVLDAIRRRKQAAAAPMAASAPAYEPPAPAPAPDPGRTAPSPYPAPVDPKIPPSFPETPRPVPVPGGGDTRIPWPDSPAKPLPKPDVPAGDQRSPWPTMAPDIVIDSPLPSGLATQAAADSGMTAATDASKIGMQTFDVGHDGTQNGMNREQYRDAWMSSGVHDIAGLRAWVAQHGGTVLSDNGTVMTPYGETLDLLIGARTGNGQAGWTASGGMQGAAGSGAGGAGGTGGGTSGDGSFQDQTRQMLMQLIADMSKPVTADDPSIKGELQSQEQGLERNRRARRGADAERAAASGLLNGGQSSGSFDTDLAAGYEDKGAQLSDVTSQLFSRELSARRDKLTQALQLAVQTGDNESARALQLQIAEMNAEIQRQSLAQQASFHNDDYGLALSEAQRQRDLDAARAAAGQAF